jgi:hypothetical protein
MLGSLQLLQKAALDRLKAWKSMANFVEIEHA